MPRSKRAQLVHLTQTSKKNREHKMTIVADVRDAIDSHSYVYLFSYENMRSDKFKAVRMHFRDDDAKKGGGGGGGGSEGRNRGSRIFLGKNKLLQLAMGRTPEDEHAPNLRRVSSLTSGSVGLLVTSRPKSEVRGYFSTLAESDFARAGSVASRTVVVTSSELSNHPTSMAERFRKLGLPAEVKDGRLTLAGGTMNEYTVCREGRTLTAEACKLLVHFGHRLAVFRVELVCSWEADGGTFEMLR